MTSADHPGRPSRRRYVAITGAPGSGKSTLARALSEHMRWDLFLEEEDHLGNEFFRDTYRDHKRWGFHHQVYYLTASAERHKILAQRLADPPAFGDAVIVEDCFPFDHTAGYGQAYARLGLISSREFRLLERLTQLLEHLYIMPDLLLFRRAQNAQLATRVKLRRRPSEKLPLVMLNSISQAFDELFLNWTRCPLIVLDSDFDLYDDLQFHAVLQHVAHALATPNDQSPSH